MRGMLRVIFDRIGQSYKKFWRKGSLSIIEKGSCEMRHFFSEIKLSNSRNQILKPVVVRALADTGALMLVYRSILLFSLSLKWSQGVKLLLQMVGQ
jgi:hypothetical protein